MSKSPSLLFAASLLALIASGCCSVDRVYRPVACTDGSWDPVLGSCHNCDGGDNGDAQTPCQSARHQLTCGSGCGDIYWGEWLSDPPDKCDPCDGCGNWIGPRCCPPRWWQQLSCGASGMWGWRCGADVGCGHGPGCTSCGTEDSGVWSGTELGEYYDPADKPNEPHQAAPRPQTGPVDAKPEPVVPPQPMPETQAARARNSRHSTLKPQPMQPTRSTRAPQQRSATSVNRPRSL